MGLFLGAIVWAVIFGKGTILHPDEKLIQLAMLAASISTIITVGILLRPLIRGKSIGTSIEGLFSGVTGWFDIMGVVTSLVLSQRLPSPT